LKKTNPSVTKDSGAYHKREKTTKEINKMDECCLVVIIVCLVVNIVACVKMWRTSWKEIENLCLIVMERFG
jgi:hypothetical protein